ncbi:MAG TPA: cardiolipin synthase B, partial [Gammaproteobacteria bacterium]|nr:cardiolipin synthase B [Gammaproteobacteria bacterium]
MHTAVAVDSCFCNPLPKSGSRHDAIQLYTEGDTLFTAMLAAIGTAQQRVWMETYIFADDEIGRRFARALSERARAGVEVRLLVDAVGSLFQFHHSLGRDLAAAGVQVNFFHRWHWREPLRYNRR